MKYLHWDFQAADRSAIVVTLDKQANVLLMDSNNFEHFRNGRQYRYQGGLAQQSPVWLHPPHAGRWHVVVNLGGYRGQVRASARLVQ